ncbi:MAG: histidine kinase dimerization/phospho-acceptor domain-containing protein, partial [Sphingobium sp.]
IGLSIGEVAPDGGSGPDGHVAGAFARRSGFQNGRFAIVGGTMAGEWRMTATPAFDRATGRFQGYRGQARRPHLHEVAPAPGEAAGFAGMSADSLRQLVHELRTPLNAILGFAEIIEQQLFGPTTPQYCEMAGKIALDARHLLAAFDDLDLAARVARDGGGGDPRPLDSALLITQTVARFHDASRADAPRLDIALAHDLPPVRLDAVQGERMVQHLLRTLLSVAAPGETLAGSAWFEPDGRAGRVLLAVARPAGLMGMEEEQLFDPGYTLEGEWADGPLLGLGFSLRLIRSLTAESGGKLMIEPTRLVLAMPGAETADGAASEA